MEQLTHGELSVPQVFFNERHIGGADATIAILLEKWDVAGVQESYHIEIARELDPQDARLALTTTRNTPSSQEETVPARPKELLAQWQGGKIVSTLETIETLKRVLPSDERPSLMKTCRNSFKAKNGIAAMAAHFSISQEEAMKLGRSLQEANIIQSTCGSKSRLLDADSHVFQLQCFHEPDVLNSYRVWTEQVDPNALGLVKRLRTQLSRVLAAFTDTDGMVDYKKASKHADYVVFEEAVCELQGIHVQDMNDRRRLAFCINVYNMMVQYAFCKVGIPKTNRSRSAFFGKVKVNLGGMLFSFDDLENGVMRGNRRHPYALFPQFSFRDTRLPAVMANTDCRIHFALNCGAKSCPPIHDFTEESLEEELRIVSRAFCQGNENARVDVSGSTLYLSKIFYWYRVDFAESNNALPEKVLEFLGGTKYDELKTLLDGGHVLVKFLEYDWATYASDSLTFSG